MFKKLFKRFKRKREVHILDTALDPIVTKVKTSNLNNVEVGGYLIGYKHRGDIYIVKVMYCSNSSRHGKFKYKGQYGLYAREIQKIYRESSGKFRIIGEWHSHPGRTYDPSKQDEDTVWKKRWLNSFFILGIVTYVPQLIWTAEGKKCDVQMHTYHYRFGFRKKRTFLGSQYLIKPGL